MSQNNIALKLFIIDWKELLVDGERQWLIETNKQ